MKEVPVDSKWSMGFGLGFEASAKDYETMAEKRRQRKADRMGKSTSEGEKIDARALYQNFMSSGCEGEGMNQQAQEEEEIDQKIKGLAVNAVTEEIPRSHPWVYPMAQEKN
ncbi:syntaxin [Corchorus olitorius]|uniref:Syntaxin n=1 Tax=Corchorus olitorius TaxID=93759 RepID=A0A1R3H0Q0_9ROSI|nr:syntaxin [Corchorus olitorius]